MRDGDGLGGERGAEAVFVVIEVGRVEGGAIARAWPREGPGLRVGSEARGAAGAIVALERPGDEALRAVRGARERGLRVIAAAGGLEGWSLAGRCAVLAAGARAVLDMGSGSFGAELGAAVRSVVAEWAAEAGAKTTLDAALQESGAVGASAAGRAVFSRALALSGLVGVPILVTGETGTGKEVLARFIHRHDPRHQAGEMVAVNCAAIGRDLAESELFGHVRGAYTGAQGSRAGAIARADGGTLFLDEVGELDGAVQAKLLRAIQEREFTPLGGDESRRYDARIIAATNRPLRALARGGTFRADLYYRLSAATLEMPPLRERREDIAPLAERFLREAAGNLRLAEVATGEALEALSRLPLEGNARELRSIVLEAMVAASGRWPIGLGDLPAAALEAVADGAGEHGACVEWARAVVDEDMNLARNLARCERAVVSRALEACGGNQARAARALGVTPRCVYSKVRMYGLKARGA